MGETVQLSYPTGRERGGWTTWLLALAVASPAFAPLLGHYLGFWHMGLQPTGFIIYDSAYYLANAREHFDSGQFTALYSNAYSFDYSSPRIYFQPLTLVLGALLDITRVDPGVLFALVGIVTAAACGRAALALFDRFGNRSQPGGTITFVAFFWGGGVFVLVGTLLSLRLFDPSSNWFDVSGWWWFVRVADPAGGWWFLNLGRNVALPTEALYHALFFATIAAIISRRFQLAALLLTTLSMSHPFTGLQLLGIIGAWSALELIMRTRVIPWWFLICVGALIAVHIAYYLWFLPRFPEHQQLQRQWTLRWTLSFPQSLLAYGIVGTLALATLGTPARFRRAFSEWPNRLLLVWLAVSLVLENHDLFVHEPVQPLHFTRGYSWVALFLLGLPTLSGFFRRVRESANNKWSAWAVAAVAMTVLLADNAVWLGGTTTQGLGMRLGRDLPVDSLRQGFGLTQDQRDVLKWMNNPQVARRVVLSEDMELGYLLTAYTPLRSWRSHYANTPWSERRRAELAAFFEEGKVAEPWRKMPILVVFRSSTPWRDRIATLAPASITPAFENPSYVVVRVGTGNP